NAIKFTEQGSVTVSATPINDWQWLEISVCDTGIGIAPDQFGTIFESFGQVHNASTNAHQHDGSGLGLTVSQQLVMLHGGSINVDSTLGEGTTLRFTLPIATADSGPNQSADVQQRQADILAVEAQFDSWQYQQAAHDGSRFHLLLVDDESEQREILYHHLSSRNYRLTQAGGGKQALQMMAEQGPFDLILLDILMPDMSGYDVCNQIRQTFPVNDLPVIFLTAQNQVVDVVQSFAIGANDYLNKPVAKHELLARVETHLRLLDINRNLEHKVADRTHELEQSNRRTTELIDVCTEITATLDRNKLLDIAFKHIRELMDADALMIGHFQKHLDCIIFNLGIENNEYLPTFFVGMDEPAQPAIWCIEHREPVIINDLDLDYARYFGDQPRGDPLIGRPTASLMYWPLIVGDQVIGVLSVQSYKKHAYDAHHQALIQTLVPTLAIALDNTVAYRQIEQKNREVKEKHREIVATQQQLVQAEKMASLGTLTAGVAHEINNPTNFVHVSAQNLRVDLSKFQTFLLNLAGENADEAILDSFKARFEPLYTHLATIENGTERIKTIVRDLRTFSQLDAATKKTVKITELLQSTVHLIHTNFLEITQFTTEFMDTPAVPCYPAQLNQVFMNLMVNACDAIRDKQRQQREQHEADCANQANTTDYHKTELGQITIGCRLIDDKVEITIKDTGCGMSAETQKRLFEPFYTTKDVGEGTGLGLSISFGIVQKHEGELSVTSELGSGTVFTLLLPVGDVA
ncbi:MAG: signal transduction histidine kinase/DNA-binding response OmpR family regulator, partial [Phenylobacterium sp.]